MHMHRIFVDRWKKLLSVATQRVEERYALLLEKCCWNHAAIMLPSMQRKEKQESLPYQKYNIERTVPDSNDFPAEEQALVQPIGQL